MHEEAYGAPDVDDLLDVPGVVAVRRGDRGQPPGVHPGLVLLDGDAGDETRERVRRRWLDLYRRWNQGAAVRLRTVQVTGLSRENLSVLMTPISRSAAGQDFQRYAVMAYPLTRPRCMVLELRAGTPDETAERARATAQLAMAHEVPTEMPVIVAIGHLHFALLEP